MSARNEMPARRIQELATTPTEVKLLSFCLIHAQRVFQSWIFIMFEDSHTGDSIQRISLEISIGSFDKNYLSNIVYVFR